MNQTKKKVGRPKGIQDPQKLEEWFKAYKIFTKENPRFKYHLNQRTGDMVGEPLEVPLTLEGFSVFVHQNHNVWIDYYMRNKDGRYEEFAPVARRIREEVRNDQIIGGMCGQYNSSITARLNALKENIEQTNIEQPLFPDVSKNNSN